MLALIQDDNLHRQPFQCQGHNTKVKGQGCLKMPCCTTCGKELLYNLQNADFNIEGHMFKFKGHRCLKIL